MQRHESIFIKTKPPCKNGKWDLWQADTQTEVMVESVHCKDTMPKILNKDSQKRKCAATVPQFLHSCFCERFICIFPPLVCLFCCRKIGGPMVEVDRSQTYECGNRDWGYSFSGNTWIEISLQCAIKYSWQKCWFLWLLYSMWVHACMWTFGPVSPLNSNFMRTKINYKVGLLAWILISGFPEASFYLDIIRKL